MSGYPDGKDLQIVLAPQAVALQTKPQQGTKATSDLSVILDESSTEAIRLYRSPEDNPFVVHLNLSQMMMKPNQLASFQNGDGEIVCVNLARTSRVWDTSIVSQFKEVLTDQMFNFDAIKNALLNLGTRLQQIQKVKKRLVPDLFEAQLQHLKARIQEHQQLVTRMEKLHEQAKWYNYQYGEIAPETESQKAYATQRKELSEQLLKLEAHEQQSLSTTELEARIATKRADLEEAERSLKAHRNEVSSLNEQVNNLSVTEQTLTVNVEDAKKKKAEFDQRLEELRKQEKAWGDDALTAIKKQDKGYFDKLKSDGAQKTNGYWAPIIEELKNKKAALMKDTCTTTIVKSHLIFVCDSSWSLKDTDYSQMMASVASLVQARGGNTDSAFDQFSVVLFACTAEIRYQGRKVCDGFIPPKRTGGGTNFEEAFKTALSLAQENSLPHQVIIFMTDGVARTSGLSALFGEHKCKSWRQGLQSFRVFVVGYGPSTSSRALNEIAEAGNEGRNRVLVCGQMVDYVYEAADANSLHKCYQLINSNVDLEHALKQKELRMVEQRIVDAEKDQCAELAESAKKVETLQDVGLADMRRQKGVCEGLAEETQAKIAGIEGEKGTCEKDYAACAKELLLVRNRLEARTQEREQAKEKCVEAQNRIDKVREKLRELEACMEKVDQRNDNSTMVDTEDRGRMKQNRQLVQDSEHLKENEEHITQMLNCFKNCAQSLSQNLAFARDYLEEELHQDAGSALDLCLQKLATIYGVTCDERDLGIGQRAFMKKLIRAVEEHENRGAVDVEERSALNLVAKYFNLGAYMPAYIKYKLLENDDGAFKKATKGIVQKFEDQVKFHYFGDADAAHGEWKAAKQKSLEAAISAAEEELEAAEQEEEQAEEKDQQTAFRAAVKAKKDKLKDALRAAKAWEKGPLKEAERALEVKEKQAEKQFEEVESQLKDFLDRVEEKAREAVEEVSYRNLGHNVEAFCKSSMEAISRMRNMIPEFLELLNNPSKHADIIKERRRSRDALWDQ